ncbi:MAG TPA: amidohydrolase family protein [Solirubrobacteraceae bacterium]|jgi:aminocarboxymuconate-semialdehyde decarboxylase|nr:amidohydrolase family protein [Solirubrobacteraceae bacterium]
MKIDVHNHALPQAVIELVSSDPRFGVKIEDGLVKRANYADHPLFDELHLVPAKLAQLDRAGLDGAVVCVEPSMFGYHLELDLGVAMAQAANDGLRALCAEAPGRLQWLAHVPLRDPARAAEVLAEAVSDGAVGVEIGSNAAGTRLDEPEVEPFWNAVEETGVTVFVHNAYNPKVPGLDRFYLHNVIGNLLETTICAERLVAAGTLDRHPGARVVLGHAGGFVPFQAGRLRHASTIRKEFAHELDLWSYAGRLIFDTITHDPAALTYLVSRAGAENVVMGTDFPYDMATPHPMDELHAAVDETTARVIAEEVPARLFPRAAA